MPIHARFLGLAAPSPESAAPHVDDKLGNTAAARARPLRQRALLAGDARRLLLPPSPDPSAPRRRNRLRSRPHAGSCRVPALVTSTARRQLCKLIPSDHGRCQTVEPPPISAVAGIPARLATGPGHRQHPCLHYAPTSTSSSSFFHRSSTGRGEEDQLLLLAAGSCRCRCCEHLRPTLPAVLQRAHVFPVINFVFCSTRSGDLHDTPSMPDYRAITYFKINFDN
jgi:hypothetical protein